MGDIGVVVGGKDSHVLDLIAVCLMFSGEQMVQSNPVIRACVGKTWKTGGSVLLVWEVAYLSLSRSHIIAGCKLKWSICTALL